MRQDGAGFYQGVLHNLCAKMRRATDFRFFSAGSLPAWLLAPGFYRLWRFAPGHQRGLMPLVSSSCGFVPLILYQRGIGPWCQRGACPWLVMHLAWHVLACHVEHRLWVRPPGHRLRIHSHRPCLSQQTRSQTNMQE